MQIPNLPFEFLQRAGTAATSRANARPPDGTSVVSGRVASAPEPQPRPAPAENPRLTPDPSALRYSAVAQALRRLIAGAAISHIAVLLILAAVLAGFDAGTAADLPATKEYQIKAAFLYNFAKFVEWPASAHQDAASPLIIGVFGKNPFGSELEKAVKDRKINGREILVKAIETADAARTVHLLFAGAGEDARLDSLREALKGSCVLMVGESDAFARQGGIIRFSLDADKVRFEINMDAAEQAGLKISAQLQKLAKAIKRQS
jgi:hypothetical protein